MKTDIVQGVELEALSPRKVKQRFLDLIEGGVTLRADGQARKRPEALLERGCAPTHMVRLFETTYYLARLRRDVYFRFFVAYVHARTGDRSVHARLFYKDTSLIWRSGSHCILTDDEEWVGKGAIKPYVVNGAVEMATAEETTNLPFEIQRALDHASRAFRTVPLDHDALGMVLRNAPPGRIAPYADFEKPRRRAMARKRDRVNGGAPIARFEREGDPTSLRFVPGFEPDFRGGVIEEDRSASRLYDGEVRKYRILSRNREIQYVFVATPRLVWILPPQALTTEITTYGQRPVDVEHPEELCLPGYEFHFLEDEDDPASLYSQIPAGFAGEQSPVDPTRAETSPWLERMPVIRAFRRAIPLPWDAPPLPKRSRRPS